MLHAVIMAGGSGTRFWPASRSDYPKQLLKLSGNQTMIQATVSRLGELVPTERLLIVTAEKLVEPIAEQLPNIPKTSIVGEPCRRDTAPCIGLAAFLIAKQDPDGIMAVMPADHVISPDDVFQQALKSAADLIQERPNSIVTFGIKPTYPAEIFGYIQRSEQTPGDLPEGSFNVQDFKEKPSREVAQQYLDSGTYYWNAGIFIWRAQLILDALEKHQPAMYQHLKAISDAHGTDSYQNVLEKEFAAIEGVSIDYAVMEHYKDRVVIEAPFNWDDVGNWPALTRLHETNDDGNTIVGKHVGIQTSDCIIHGPDNHLIATLGVSNLIIVNTPDATLVADRSNEESLRKLVDLIGQEELSKYL